MGQIERLSVVSRCAPIDLVFVPCALATASPWLDEIEVAASTSIFGEDGQLLQAFAGPEAHEQQGHPHLDHPDPAGNLLHTASPGWQTMSNESASST